MNERQVLRKLEEAQAVLLGKGVRAGPEALSEIAMDALGAAVSLLRRLLDKKPRATWVSGYAFGKYEYRLDSNGRCWRRMSEFGPWILDSEEPPGEEVEEEK